MPLYHNVIKALYTHHIARRQCIVSIRKQRVLQATTSQGIYRFPVSDVVCGSKHMAISYFYLKRVYATAKFILTHVFEGLMSSLVKLFFFKLTSETKTQYCDVSY